MPIARSPQYFTFNNPYDAGDIFVQGASARGQLEASPLGASVAVTRGTGLTISYKVNPAALIDGGGRISFGIYDAVNPLTDFNSYTDLIADNAYHDLFVPYIVPQTADLFSFDLYLINKLDSVSLDGAFTLHDIRFGAAPPSLFWTRDIQCQES
jgi:hypothetical protein